MDDLKNNKLPPIIVNYIEKIKDPHITDFTKEFYARNLEHIREVVSNELDKYYRKSSSKK